MARWVEATKVRSIVNRLKIDLSDWSNEDIEDAIDLHQNIFKTQVGRAIESTAKTARVDGAGIPSLVAPDWPIITLTQVTLLGYPNEIYGPSDLYVESETGILWLLARVTPTLMNNWPVGERNIEIQATYGYSTIPAEIKEAITLAASAHILMIETSSLTGADLSPNVEAFRIGNYSERYGKGGRFSTTIQRWDAIMEKVASQYRNRRIL